MLWGERDSLLTWLLGLRPDYPELMPCSQGPRVETQNSYSTLPALDALVRFIQDFEDVISFDFSKSLKSCIAPRNLEIMLSETNGDFTFTAGSKGHQIDAPNPMERSLQISRTMLLRVWFIAQRALSSSFEEYKTDFFRIELSPSLDEEAW